MKVLIIGINSVDEFGLAPAFLKAHALKDSLIRERVKIVIRGFKGIINDNIILSEIEKEKADLIAFSCYLWNVDKILRICRKIKSNGLTAPIILGGPEVSSLAKSILLENKSVDIVVRDEGEITFCEIIRHFLLKEKKNSDILGITFRDKKEIVENKPRPLIENLDDIPSPYLNNIIDLNKRENRWIPFQTFRGCIFKCAFCGQNSRTRYFSIERIKEELITIMNSKVQRVYFTDGSCDDKDRLKQILQTISKHNRNEVSFDFELKAELLDSQSIDLLAKVSQGYVAFGLQSTNLLALKKINRIWDKEKFEKNINLLKKRGKNIISIDLIFGLPNDNLKNLQKSIAYVMSLKPQVIQYHRLSILPGSSLYKSAKRYGIVFMKKSPHFLLKSKSFSSQDLIEANKWVDYLGLYCNSAVYATVVQLSNYINVRPLRIFNSLIDYLKKRLDIKKPTPDGLYTYLSKFIKIKFKNFYEIIPPFLEIIKCLCYEQMLEQKSMRREKPYFMKSKPFNIIKFNYDIKEYVEQARLDKKVDFKKIAKKITYFIYSIDKEGNVFSSLD